MNPMIILKSPFSVIHRLRVYQFEKQKGHLIIPPEEGPEIAYPKTDIDDRLKNWYISIQPLLKENSL